MSLDGLELEWEEKEDGLVLELSLKNFNEVVKVVNEIAKVSENLDHHPDLRIFSYKKLEIVIFTHEEDAITEKDYKLASEIEKVLNKYSLF